MIYLKSFNLPKDTWVDEYFSPIPYAPPQDLPDVYDKLRAEFDNRTIHRSWYPWKTFYNRDFCHIELSDITIFYANNASGKTTVLNVIAEIPAIQTAGRMVLPAAQ